MSSLHVKGEGLRKGVRAKITEETGRVKGELWDLVKMNHRSSEGIEGGVKVWPCASVWEMVSMVKPLTKK